MKSDLIEDLILKTGCTVSADRAGGSNLTLVVDPELGISATWEIECAQDHPEGIIALLEGILDAYRAEQERQHEHGTRWTRAQDEELCTLFMGGASVQEISLKLRRTPRAIEHRLSRMKLRRQDVDR